MRSPLKTVQVTDPADDKIVDFSFLSGLTYPAGVSVILMNKFQTILGDD